MEKPVAQLTKRVLSVTPFIASPEVTEALGNINVGQLTAWQVDAAELVEGVQSLAPGAVPAHV
jgi:hypothetical protein